MPAPPWRPWSCRAPLKPFAEVAAHLLRRLGGVYAETADRLERGPADSKDAGAAAGAVEPGQETPAPAPSMFQQERGDRSLVSLVAEGIDVLHQTFQDAAGRSRVLEIWDQNDPTGPTPRALYGQQVPDYGTVHTASDLQSYLTSGAVPARLSRNPAGYGTHVASLAAGRAVESFTGGLASESRIVVVIAWLRVSPGDPPALGYSLGHVDALAYIRQVARARELPVVVIFPLGMNTGAHDGTSPLEQAFDAFSGGGREPGLVVVKSAGNERAAGGHARFTLASSSSESLRWTSPGAGRSGDLIDLWFRPEDALSFRLRDPAGYVSALCNRDNPTVQGAFPSGNTYALTYTRYHPDNGDSRLLVSVRPGKEAESRKGSNPGEISTGFDLRLMSALNDVSGIPTEGKNLIIVAAVNHLLHFRIFDGDGKLVVDIDEKSLVDQGQPIEDLRKHLESLGPPHEMTRSEKDQVVTSVTSIIGRTLSTVSESDDPLITPGVWSLEVSAGRLRSPHEIHAWIERDDIRATRFLEHLDENCTLTIPGTARSVLTIGAAESEAPLRASPVSSAGPTRDGRDKPEIVAPAVAPLGAKAGTNVGMEVMSGTHTAAAHVAGAVALVLSRAAKRANAGGIPSANQIRAALIRTARYNNGNHHSVLGYGLLDTKALFDAFEPTALRAVAEDIPGPSNEGESEPVRPPRTVHLTGNQRELLVNALVDDFDRQELEMLMAFRLGERLGNIVDVSGPLDAIVFRLLQWAERMGRTEELVRAAVQARPKNAALRAVAEEYLGDRDPMSAPDLTTRLVDFLVRIPALLEPANRSLLLNGLPAGLAFSIARHAAPLADLHEIVQAALSVGRLRSPDRLAIEVLLDNTVPFIRGTQLERELDVLRESWRESEQPPTIPTRPVVMDRGVLVRTLAALSPADFDTLVLAIAEAAQHVSRHGSVPQKVAELVRWAESPTGPGLATIGMELDVLRESWRESEQPPTIPTRPVVMDRGVLVRTLAALSPADFDTLVVAIPEAAQHVSRHGSVPQKVAELVRWAESPTGPGLATIGMELDVLRESWRESEQPPTIPTRPVVMDRGVLVRTLAALSPADFDTLVLAIPEAAQHVSRHGSVPQKVAELFRWAESPTGPGLATIGAVAEDILGPSNPS